MPTIEERVAFLEGRVAEHSRGMDGIRDALSSLEARMDRRFESLEARVHSVEERFDRRLTDMDAKMSRQFVWLVGILVTGMTAMVTVMATIASKM